MQPRNIIAARAAVREQIRAKARAERQRCPLHFPAGAQPKATAQVGARLYCGPCANSMLAFLEQLAADSDGPVWDAIDLYHRSRKSG